MRELIRGVLARPPLAARAVMTHRAPAPAVSRISVPVEHYVRQFEPRGAPSP
jgi:hypothetical protein